MNDDIIISFKNVNYRYESDDEEISLPLAIKNFNLDIHKGEFIAILGHNGSGKSTIAKLSNAIIVPESGHVLVNGMDTDDEDNELKIRQTVGVVFQNPDNQLVATVVEEDVAFGPENLGVPQKEIRQRVDEALKALGMYEYRFSEPHKLSGGQKQRVAIAGIMAMKTECIVLDEPTAMLDPQGRREVVKYMQKLNKELGLTIVLITHYMDEAVLADRIIVMTNGEKVAEGTPKQVFAEEKILENAGLSLPDSARLASDLRKKGMKLPDGILTPDDFINAYSNYVNK